MNYGNVELARILDRQRAAFLMEGSPSAQVRRSRVTRLALALLENIDAIAEALDADYGHRPPALSKVFEALSWVQDAQHILDNLDKWMAPAELPGGFVQQKPKGVVGIVGAWNFPVTLTFEPALSALAAGNRVMLNWPEYHIRTGALLADIIAGTFAEDEVAFIHGDLATAQHFSELRFDHLFFTGSPKVGAIVSQAASKNLVPITTELGGKNPVVIAPNADLDLAAERVATTRMLNSGQICLCPDYVFVPRPMLEIFARKVQAQFAEIFPSYLNNPAVVSIVNERNFDRIVGLIDDAVAKGARKIAVAPEGEIARLPDRLSRRIPPTLLLDVPESAQISHEEVFGPVLVLYAYDALDDAIEYITSRPSPLAAYWYGEDDVDFRRFLDCTNSGGVTRNDGLVHATLPGAPFGGIGNSGSGAYHGKAGFDTFTHRRTVANVTQAKGIAKAFLDGSLFSEAYQLGLDGALRAAIDGFRHQEI